MDEQTPAEFIPQDRANAAARFYNKLHRYKNLLLTKFWIPLLTVGLAVGAQLVLLHYAAPKFLSVGRMIVSTKLSLPNAQSYSDEMNNFYGTQVALMESDSVTNQVWLRLQAMQATNASLHPSPVTLEVTVSPKTSIFNLQAVGENPEYTQDYLEGVMEEYINLKKNLLENSLDATKYGLQDEVGQIEQQLEQSQQAVLDYQSSNSVVFLQQNGNNNAADYLTSLNRQLADDRSELQLLEKLTLDENLERAQGVFAPTPTVPQPPPVIAGSPPNSAPQTSATQGNTQNSALSANSSPAGSAAAGNNSSANNGASTLGQFEQDYLQAKQQLLLLKAKRDELAVYLRPKHPKIIDLNQQITDQEKLLEIFKGQSLEELENSKHTLEVEIQNLEASIQEWEVKAVDVSKKLSDYQTLENNVTRLQNMHDQLLMNIQTLSVDQQVGDESVSILEAASPGVPYSSNFLRLAIAGFLGLVVGMGILMLLDHLDDRPASFAELEQMFDEPVLGQIPLVKAKDKKAGVLVLQPNDDRHALVEAYRNLRSSLLFMDSSSKSPKRIALTSAIPSEGKSMTTANLAITLARSGSRVLLVDADLRRGVLHKHFSVVQSPGLSEALAGQCNWAEAVVQTSTPNLYLLPRGVPPQHAGELMSREAVNFLKKIAGQYDYYLFDTAPVMAADDVSDLAPHLDGLIMVIRAGFTSGRVAHAALELLYLRKVNVLGLVFNAVRPNAGEYYYYQYKEYYTSTPAA